MTDYSISALQKSGLPMLPGLHPWAILENDAKRAYAAWRGGRTMVESYLHKHAREDVESFKDRQKYAQAFGYTTWSLSRLLRTIDNAAHPVERTFETSWGDLEAITTRTTASGKTWDGTLKDLALHAELGGVAYAYIDTSRVVRVDDATGILDASGTLSITVLRVQQVSCIKLDADGYITQCVVISDDCLRAIVYADGMYQEYVRDRADGQFVPGVAGPLPGGSVPIVPLPIDGSMDDLLSLRTPVQDIAANDEDLMNLWSDARQALAMHNFPILKIPGADQRMGPQETNARMQPFTTSGVPWNPSERKSLNLGAMTAITFSKEDGEPGFIEASYNHLDATFKYHEMIVAGIYAKLGAATDQDHPLASGVAKAYDFHDISEIHRQIHSRLQALEYQVWYLVARMVFPARVTTFDAFRDQVTIQHPVHFDPTGGQVRARLAEAATSPALDKMPPPVQTEIRRQWATAYLNDLMPPDQLAALMKSFDEPAVTPTPDPLAQAESDMQDSEDADNDDDDDDESDEYTSATA